jgi:hypothetical protein
MFLPDINTVPELVKNHKPPARGRKHKPPYIPPATEGIVKNHKPPQGDAAAFRAVQKEKISSCLIVIKNKFLYT